MSGKLTFADIKENQELTAIKKDVTSVNLMMYCAAIWLTDRIHFDDPYAKKRGLPGPVAPGNMGPEWYTELLSNWLGDGGEIRRLSVQYRQFMVVGDTITCGGKVTGKYEKDGKKYADLELWLRNQRDEVCVPGKATVELTA